MTTRAQSLALLLLAAALRSAMAQELIVLVESTAFTLDTRLASSSDTAALVVTAASPPFTLDTRLVVGSALSALVVTAESADFTLDTRLAGGNVTLATLVVTAESPAFALDARLAGTIDALIVEAVSPAFTLNTMWVGIRRTARVAGSLVDLYWSTNVPGFRLQSAAPPLGPAATWQDLITPPNQSGGLNHVLLNPAASNLYFRLKL